MTFVSKRSKSRSDPKVVVVGSGPSGVAVADTLRERGISSVVFEAGISVGNVLERGFDSMAEYRNFVRPRWEVDEVDWNYEADRNVFDWIRVRALGGRSLRWRGWLAKPQPENFTLASDSRGRWPFMPAEMDKFYGRALRWLNATPSILDTRFADLSDRCGECVWPKVAAASSDRVRPFCSIDRLAALSGTAHGARIVIRDRAAVTRVIYANNETEGIEYRELLTGKTRRISARVVVLAASPIETTRILLQSELAEHTDAFALVGKHYLDHVASSYLAILPERVATPLGTGLLDGSATMPVLTGCSRSFREAYGGFTIELNGPNPASLYEPEILSAASLDPVDDRHAACISVNAMGELLRSPKRSVRLADSCDGLRRFMPRINIGWEDNDEALARMMESEAERIATILAGKWGRVVKVRKTLTLGGTGTSHEAGTCPIGLTDRDSVVDRNGQIHGINGLYIADASLFPTALDCHPTLTAVALALNTADGVTRHMNRSG